MRNLFLRGPLVSRLREANERRLPQAGKNFLLA